MVADTFLEILCSWFGVPVVDARRAEFLCILGRHLPLAAFMLEEVWMAYQQPEELTPVSRAKARSPTAANLEQLEYELKLHPLSVSASQAALFVGLQRSVEAYLGRSGTVMVDEPGTGVAPNE